MEVICDLDGSLEPGGSTCDADPIAVAQRLRDAQNRAALRPQGPAERASSPDEAAGGTAGTWPTQLQVDAGVAVLALPVSLKGGAVGCLLRLETAASASRGVSGAFAKPKGQQRAAAPPATPPSSFRTFRQLLLGFLSGISKIKHISPVSPVLLPPGKPSHSQTFLFPFI